MKLVRGELSKDGIFSLLSQDDGSELFLCLEHAYQDGNVYVPKLPNGTYVCVRGLHTLEHHPEPFETFEITRVPGHSDILFHIGNSNADSAGCVLLGLARNFVSILNSKDAFAKFMNLMVGIDSFTLEVL